MSKQLTTENARLTNRQWPSLLSRLYRLYFATLRVSALLPDGRFIPPGQYPSERVIFAHSERDDLVLAGILPCSRFTVLVALGRDGNWATQALESLGCAVVRGSILGNGSRALSRLIHHLRDSPGPAGICVDGPLGPQGRAKMGVLVCARHTNRPIIPLGTAARRRIVFRKTWSQIFLPLPFSEVVISCGSPLRVTEEAGRREIEDLSAELSRRLRMERERAEEAIRK